MEGLNTFTVSTVAEKRLRVERVTRRAERKKRFIGLILSVYRSKIQKSRVIRQHKHGLFLHPGEDKRE